MSDEAQVKMYEQIKRKKKKKKKKVKTVRDRLSKETDKIEPAQKPTQIVGPN